MLFSVFSIIFSYPLNEKFSTHHSSSVPICSSTISNMQLNLSLKVCYWFHNSQIAMWLFYSFQFLGGILSVAIKFLNILITVG